MSVKFCKWCKALLRRSVQNATVGRVILFFSTAKRSSCNLFCLKNIRVKKPFKATESFQPGYQTHSVGHSSLIGHIFAGVCEVQLRLCITNFQCSKLLRAFNC